MLLELHYKECLDDMIDEWHTTNTELTLQEYLCLEDKDFQEFIISGKIDTNRILSTIQETLQRIDYIQFDSNLSDLPQADLTVTDFKKLLSVCNIKLNCKHSDVEEESKNHLFYESMLEKYIKPLSNEEVDYYTYVIKVKLEDIHQLLGIAYKGGI